MIPVFVVVSTLMECLGHRSDVRVPNLETLTIAIVTADEK
jgi:hypothetical protein